MLKYNVQFYKYALQCMIFAVHYMLSIDSACGVLSPVSSHSDCLTDRQTVAWISAPPPGPAALSLVSKPERDQWAIYLPGGKLSVHTTQVKPQSMSDQTDDTVLFEWIPFFTPWFNQSERG